MLNAPKFNKYQLTEYLERKTKNRQQCLTLNPRKKDRHKLNFKTRHWVRFLRQENYLLTSLEEIIKGALSGGCRFSYIALNIDKKNLFFFKGGFTKPSHFEKQKDYLFAHLVWREKEELDNLLAKRPHQFRKKWQEIKTKVEILSKWDNPAKLVPGYKENGRPKPTWEGVGWNSPDYRETKNRSLAALAFTHEIVLGKVDTPLLDLDPNKKDKDGNYKVKQAWLRKDLSEGGKKWKVLINKNKIPYYWKTATPGNSLLPIPWLAGLMKGQKIYHQDTGQEIGDLLGKGDLVALPVGSDKNRQLIITKWGRKLVKKHGVAGILGKSVLGGDIEERVEKVLNDVFLSLDKSEVITKPKTTKQFLINQQEESLPKLSQNIQAKILSKHKIPWLADFIKVWYKSLNSKQNIVSYFLLNYYQRAEVLPDLTVGSMRNICLIKGTKHTFFSRIIT